MVDAFGSKLTDLNDQSIINHLIETTFVESSFDVDFQLVKVEGGGVMTLPEKTTREECLGWVSTIPPTTPPTWVGLDANAEIELEQTKVRSISNKIQKLCDVVTEKITIKGRCRNRRGTKDGSSRIGIG